ncbi:MAG: DMT family transporter [Xanthomonadales bacterium]|nr:DMT family transporter [Xanthomonadales bacterium]
MIARHRSNIYLLLAAFMWGVSTPLSKIFLDYYEPTVLLSIQLAFSVSFIWTLIFIKREKISMSRANLWPIALVGLLEPGAAYFLGLSGLVYTTAISAGFIQSLEPLFIILLAIPILKKKMTWNVVFVIALSMLGLYVLTDLKFSELLGNMYGDFLVMLGALSAGFYVVVSSKLVRKHSTILVLGIQQLSSLVMIAVVAYFATDWNAFSFNWEFFVWAGIMGIVQFSLSFLFYFMGLEESHPFWAGITLNFIAIFALLGAVLILNESVSSRQLIGGLMIVMGALFLSQKSDAETIELEQ